METDRYSAPRIRIDSLDLTGWKRLLVMDESGACYCQVFVQDQHLEQEISTLSARVREYQVHKAILKASSTR